MMDMMKKGAALMGAALLTVTLWSTPVMAAVNVPANLAAVSKTVKGAAPYGVYFSDLKTGKGYYRNSVQTPAASMIKVFILAAAYEDISCLLYTSPSPRDPKTTRMPSSA